MTLQDKIRKTSCIDSIRMRKKSVYHQHVSQPISKKRSRAATEPTIKLPTDDQSSNSGQRKRSTFFTNGSSAYEGLENDEFEADYKEHYRRTLMQMYAEDELAKDIDNISRSSLLSDSGLKTQTVEQNQLLGCIRYMATEHESLLQFLIFLPLILTSFYIVFVENKPLITWGE